MVLTLIQLAYVKQMERQFRLPSHVAVTEPYRAPPHSLPSDLVQEELSLSTIPPIGVACSKRTIFRMCLFPNGKVTPIVATTSGTAIARAISMDHLDTSNTVIQYYRCRTRWQVTTVPTRRPQRASFNRKHRRRHVDHFKTTRCTGRMMRE